MKRITLLFPIILLGLALTGYYMWWTIAATQMEKLTQNWVEDTRAQGYQVYHGEAEFSGFPRKLAMRLPSTLIVTPDEDLIYKGDALVIETLPWNPTRYRLNIIGLQTVDIAKNGFAELFALTANDAYAIADIDLDGKIKRIDFVAKDLNILATNLGDSLKLDDLSVAVALPANKPKTGKDLALTLQIIADNIQLPKSIQNPLNSKIQHLSTRFNISGPLENNTSAQAILDWQKAGGKLDIMELGLKWGVLQLSGHGEAALDDALYLLAAFEAEISGLGETMMALSDKGLVDARVAKLAAVGLQLMARKPANGGPAVVNVPISAQGGSLYLGPMRVAELPNLMGKFANKIPDRAEPAPVPKVEIEDSLPELEEPPTVNFDD